MTYTQRRLAAAKTLVAHTQRRLVAAKTLSRSAASAELHRAVTTWPEVQSDSGWTQTMQ